MDYFKLAKRNIQARKRRRVSVVKDSLAKQLWSDELLRLQYVLDNGFKLLRKGLGWSRGELAKRAKVSVRTIDKLERSPDLCPGESARRVLSVYQFSGPSVSKLVDRYGLNIEIRAELEEEVRVYREALDDARSVILGLEDELSCAYASLEPAGSVVKIRLEAMRLELEHLRAENGALRRTVVSDSNKYLEAKRRDRVRSRLGLVRMDV